MKEMKRSKPCYAIVLQNDRFDGKGRPIVMEGYLDLDFEEVEAKADELAKRYGDAVIVELPLQITTSIQRVAGSQDKVRRLRKLEEMPF